MYVRCINSVLNKRGKNVNIEQGRGLIMDREGTDGQRTAEHRQNKRKTLMCVWILFFFLNMNERKTEADETLTEKKGAERDG